MTAELNSTISLPVVQPYSVWVNKTGAGSHPDPCPSAAMPSDCLSPFPHL